MTHTFHGMPLVHLHAGELFVGKKPSIISTVLGSCVAVTFYYPAMPLGLICHGVLPFCPCSDANGGGIGNYPGSLHEECFRYMDCSVQFMVNYLGKLDIPKSHVIVKLFGGSEMFGVAESARARASVGRQNVQVATQVLKTHGLALSAINVGGQQGRKLHFFPHTGEVWMKRLGNSIIAKPPVVGPCLFFDESDRETFASPPLT